MDENARDNAEGAISTVLFGEADPVQNLVEKAGLREFSSMYTLTLIDDGVDRLSRASIFEEAEMVVQGEGSSQFLTVNLTQQTPEDVAWLVFCWVDHLLSSIH
ncbi:hypothetical protein FZC83_21355 [Rossellomorea marisflavi]|uniref:Uncharacterized protein n=1 Tax=Rossellomorea marisflavi TaxID=189381 RepID=A0A5D4RA17_9BACI|nr:hypothetical protein [Rossellomorea marisflavi]TYS48225.1 hypothetical protein FZC83_21355 [Rossellomorea marisflavi]